MTGLKHSPVRHDHDAFVGRARTRKGFSESYEPLEPEYALVDQLLSARTRAGLTQDAVAQRKGTTKSAISRLESAGRHTPSLGTLRRYAQAVGCELQLRLVPRGTSAARANGTRARRRAGTTAPA